MLYQHKNQKGQKTQTVKYYKYEYQRVASNKTVRVEQQQQEYGCHYSHFM